VDGRFYRTNQIWREVISADGNSRSELVKENFARTLYEPDLGPGSAYQAPGGAEVG
jgi:hypothetical protein